jgi:hypothetical protein
MLSLVECFLLQLTHAIYVFSHSYIILRSLLVGTVSFEEQMLFFANFMYRHLSMFV